MAAKRKPAAYKNLKSDLLANLTARGLVERIYTDKVDEYMDLWEQRQALRADIAERGVTIWDAKRGMEVENRSLSLEIQISRQMIVIFQTLGFKDAALAAKAGDTDDDL